MSIKSIEAEELREMTGKEGLILQGCGGPLQDWLDGINDMLTEAGILQNGSRFTDIYAFEHEGLTNLLFPFEDAKLDIGKLAMWRLQTFGEFSGKWLTDYVDNRLGGFIDESRFATDKPDCSLIGADGNVFNLIGIASRTLKKYGLGDQAKEMSSRVFACGSYGEALNIIGEYVNITDAEHVREFRPSVVKKIKETKVAESSEFGHAEAWCKHYGAPIEFDSKSEAQKYAAELNKDATVNCRYSVREKQHEPSAVKFPLERTPDDKVPAVGRPEHLRENYLLNAELKEEAQTGNYNMLDGRMDNLAPESAAEKSSVMDKLKTDKPRREPKQPSRGGKSQEREI